MIAVVAAALVDAGGRVLVQRRAPGGSHGGLWEFPGGKVEPGEAPAAALARELMEELGIAVDPAVAAFVAAATAPPIALSLYITRDWQGTPVSADGLALAWVASDALAALAMPPADRPLIAPLRLLL